MATPFENLVDFLSKKSSVCGRILTLQNPFHFVRRNLAHLASLGALFLLTQKPINEQVNAKFILFASLLSFGF